MSANVSIVCDVVDVSCVTFAGLNIGPVCKRDVVKASVMLEHDSQWAVILAFDIKVKVMANVL